MPTPTQIAPCDDKPADGLTTSDKRVWVNGEQVPAQQASISVFDHGVLYGDGVFEGLRVYQKRIFKLATHLRRLYESAKAIRLTIPYTPDQLEQASRQIVATNSIVDGYIRLCVTRGQGSLGINPLTCQRPTVFIIADAIELYPPILYETGMHVITCSVMRNHPASLSPRIKSLNYLNNILAKIQAIDAGVPEAVMLNHLGYVAECTGDNIVTIKQNPQGKVVLSTPPVNAGALEGVTLQFIMRLAQKAGLEVRVTDLTQHDLYIADEILLTGTAAQVVPVTHVDKRVIGTGKPGPIFRQLVQAFEQAVKQNAPED